MSEREDVEDTRVFIAPDPRVVDCGDGQLISLRHPKTGNKSCYLLTSEGLQELHWFKKSFGSWFLENYVCEDGSFYTVTPVDPIFIMLPVFEEARMKKRHEPGKFRTLDEIIFVDGYPEYRKLMSIAETAMPVVCEIKEIGSSRFFRLDDAKVFAWLNCKVHHLTLALPTLDKNYAMQNHKDTLVDAVSILGEYLKETWLERLCQELKVNLHDSRTEINTEVLPVVARDEGKSSSDKKATRAGKQQKRAKPETDSHNIMDMFRRVTRRS